MHPGNDYLAEAEEGVGVPSARVIFVVIPAHTGGNRKVDQNKHRGASPSEPPHGSRITPFDDRAKFTPPLRVNSE